MAQHLPPLGPRGEGWFAIQVALMATVAAAGVLGPAWAGPTRTASTVVGSVAIVGAGLFGGRALLDLRAAFTPLPHPIPGASLVEGGAYRVVRHPMYTAVVTGALGWGLLTASLAALGAGAVLFAFLDLKSRREETWLAGAYPGYADYRRRTRRIIPFLY